MNSNNKKWLVLITIILFGIFVIMFMEITKKTEGDKIGESISDVINSTNDGAKEFREEVIDEIDDNTKDRR